MTFPGNGFDETAFHALQRARLCDPVRMLPLGALWAEALADQLDRYCPGQLRRPVSPGTVANCFASVPQQRADALLRAVHMACETTTVMDHAATVWATELTVYAALRCLDLGLWADLRHWQGIGKQAAAVVYSVPTSSSLIAAIGAAGLHGLAVRVGAGGGVDGVIDLSGVEQMSGVTLEDHMMVRLYESLMPGIDDRSRNPYGPLTIDEIGQLQAHFAGYRIDEEYAGLYIRVPTLDQAGSEGLARCLATLLNTHVIQGTEGHSPALVGKLAITVASLKATVEQVFGMLAKHHHTGQAAATESAKPARPEPLATAKAAPPAQAYTWDLFISYASEDKTPFVNALVQELKARRLRVWYDTEQMTGGGSVTGHIDVGLLGSRYYLAVLSPQYFAKCWPTAEGRAMYNEATSRNGARLLPVLLNMDKESLARLSTLLADQRVVANAADDLTKVVDAICAAINHST